MNMRRLEKLMNQRSRQTGGLTVFTAILVLIVLTMLILYAAQVGFFEQRISANDVRQKTAFHAAEAAIEQGTEYLLANQQLLLSDAVAAFPDGSGGFRDGWRVAKWSECTADLIDDADHPCGGNSPMNVGSFFYDDPTTGYNITDIVVPVEAVDVTARVTANICKVGIDAFSTPGACLGLDEETPGGTFMIVTLLAYGYSDCSEVTDVSTCQAHATVAQPLGNFHTLAGAPTVPLVTRSVFPPNGTAIVVPNPNAGGEGVPISAWVNNNDLSSDDDPYATPNRCEQDPVALLSSGTWNTCELQEWYERDSTPVGVACDQPTCSCTESESISFKRTGIDTVIGIDIVLDDAFPCDLFHTFFQVLDENYAAGVKSTITQQPSDCSGLDETSSGVFWISGDSCSLNGSTLGSPENPIVIISAVETSITGNVEIFGLLYVFDGEPGGAEFSGAGTASIYGALIVDAGMDRFTGTVNVVYAPGVLLKASDFGGMGPINGGWRDFGLPEIAW